MIRLTEIEDKEEEERKGACQKSTTFTSVCIKCDKKKFQIGF